MKKVKILVILLVVAIITLLGIIIYNKKALTNYEKINEEVNNDIDIISKEDKEEVSYKEVLNKYRKLYNNDEIVGNLKIDNSNFDMLFAQTHNNDYYLDHLLNREYNKLGATFLDYRINIDNSKKINIYGHNNGKAGTSFNYLMNYLDKEFYNEHKKIIINTETTNYVYEIFSIQIVDSDYIHMKVDFKSSEEWLTYLDKVLNNSIFKEEINTKEVSRVLTLQTCTNRYDGQFLLVNAYLLT